MAIKCSREGCSDFATWWPILLLYAPVAYQDAPPCPAKLSLPVCDECKAEIRVEDLLSDEGFDALAFGIASAGKVRPDRDRTKLDWEAITAAEQG